MHRNNFLLIYMDDMTHWALRNHKIKTPNLDKLRRKGITFTHAFNQGAMTGAVCLPARQMLTSGLSLLRAQHDYLSVPHLGETFWQNGYETFFTGKWHNEEEALNRSYSKIGKVFFGGMLHSTEVGGAAYFRPKPNDSWEPSNKLLEGHWIKRDDGSYIHSSQYWADSLIDYLRNHNETLPFFAHIAFNAPHDPRQSPSEYLDLYSNEDIEIPPNAAPAHPFDNGEIRNRDENLGNFPRTEDTVRLHRMEYFAIISHVDSEIGRILETLTELGKDKNTYIIFTGDHGLALGEHGLLGKQSLYDHSTRVPLVISGPDIQENICVDHQVYSGSIFATLLELSSLPIPSHIFFESLVPKFCESGNARDNLIFGVYKNLQRSVRSKKYKLIIYPELKYAQFFDLENDPWEITNLFYLNQYKNIANEFFKQMQILQLNFSDELVLPDFLSLEPAPRLVPFFR